MREVPSRESSCVRTRSAVSLAKEGTCPSLPPGVFSFAFVRTAMPPAIDVQMPTTPLSADSPVLMPAGCKVVRATAAFATWTAVAADEAYGARAALPTGRMIAIFLPRCSIGPLLADVAASRKAHILNLRFYGSAWGRILAELEASGAFTFSFNTLPEFHAHLFTITITIPANLHIVASDYNLAEAWSLGAEADSAASQAIRFLSLATLDTLEAKFGPHSLRWPFSVICQLAGSIGPVFTHAARSSSSSLVQSAAILLRASAAPSASDVSLAGNLRARLLRSDLPPPLRARNASWEELHNELRDLLAYDPTLCAWPLARIGRSTSPSPGERPLANLLPGCSVTTILMATRRRPAVGSARGSSLIPTRPWRPYGPFGFWLPSSSNGGVLSHRTPLDYGSFGFSGTHCHGGLALKSGPHLWRQPPLL